VTQARPSACRIVAVALVLSLVLPVLPDALATDCAPPPLIATSEAMVQVYGGSEREPLANAEVAVSWLGGERPDDVRSGRTDDTGYIRFVGLRVGPYGVAVSAPGFKPFHQRLRIVGKQSGPSVVVAIKLGVGWGCSSVCAVPAHRGPLKRIPKCL